MSIPEPVAETSGQDVPAGLVERFNSLGERQTLLIIILLAFLVRLYMVFHTVAIANDGVIYIEMAKLFAAGNFETSLVASYPPLYPIMIWGMHHIIGDWIFAGQAVSVIFSCLLILPLYAMIRGFFNARIALVSAFLVALNPYLVRFSTDVLTEAPYIFLLVTAVWLGWEALVNDKTRLLPLSGLCCGLAYLLRPEGIGVFVIVALWVLLPNRERLKPVLSRRVLGVGLMAVVLLAVAFPYMAYIKHETGTWRLSKKKELAVLLGIRKSSARALPEKPVPNQGAQGSAIIESPDHLGTELLDGSTARARKPVNFADHLYIKGKTLLKMLALFAETYHPLLVFFAFLGFLFWRSALHNRRALVYVLSFALLYGAILYTLLLHASYLDRRHLMPLAVITVAWAAVGVKALAEWMSSRWARWRGKNISPRKVTAVLLILSAVVMLPKALKPQRLDKYHQKSVGIWLKTRSDTPPVIMAYNLPRVAFYAEGKYVPYHRGSYHALLTLAHERHVEYLVVDRKAVRHQIPGFFAHVGKGGDFLLVHEEGKLNEKMHDDLLIYAVVAQDQ